MGHGGSRRSLQGNATSACVQTVSITVIDACRGTAQKRHPSGMACAVPRPRVCEKPRNQGTRYFGYRLQRAIGPFRVC